VKLCAISVDLDEIPYYHEIHGLPVADVDGANAVYDIAVDRLADLARAHDIPMTFFVIGETLARKESAARARNLAERGHELGNHSFGHNYRMMRLDAEVVLRDIEDAQTSIEGATGWRPVGFRAPGYTVSDELFEVLGRLGFAYDSSVFPCPLYWGAKGAAIALIALAGRRSRSMIDTPNVLKAPTRPYRVGRPYWERGSGILELPIQVTRGFRLPFIGTTVTAAGTAGAKYLARMVSGEPLVNLELHGIDALDVDDGLEPLAKHQHDLKISHKKKLDAISVVIETLRADGYSFVRLDDAARRLTTV
jgi:peptidoglycan-N-acetylglucosamine deacetylase